ncbi:MAG: AMP-binding protein, partial [Gemmatimonadota bacterium]
ALIWENHAGDSRTFTYDDLRVLTNGMAKYLEDLGVEAGERVCLFMDRVPELYLGFVAILKRGAIAQPLFSAFGNESLHTRLANAGTSVIFTQKKHVAKVRKIRDQLPNLRHIIIVDGDPEKLREKEVIFGLPQTERLEEYECGATTAETPSVLLTTNDDAMNIYLTIYCRRLNPETRTITRATHERNVQAIRRAGADFVLSYASFGVQTVFSLVQGRELVVLGEGVDLFHVPLPESLAGKTLSEARIGERTGLNVIGVQGNGGIATDLSAGMRLPEGCTLITLGSAEQRERFAETY